MMLTKALKALLPDHALPLPILAGPFRGAVINLNPQYSLRKVFGLYEHELNSWLRRVLPRVNKVIDVGANDGYFTFGCAAAFRRFRKPAHILAYEPSIAHFKDLQVSLQRQKATQVEFLLRNCFVGSQLTENVVTLNAEAKSDFVTDTDNALIKIDVEGAEVEVVRAASNWLKPTNYFLIEVHQKEYLAKLTNEFERHSIKLRQINQKPLPVLGREFRSERNWWLVSDLS